MVNKERVDVYTSRRRALASVSGEEPQETFWKLSGEAVDTMVEEARTHTTPSIERAVLLHMGFDSSESARLVEWMEELNLLGQGAAQLIQALAKQKKLTMREAGMALLGGKYWDQLLLLKVE